MALDVLKAAKVRTLASETIMGKWLRRIRGAIGMGLTWAVVWSGVGSMPRWLFGFNTDVPFPLVFGVLGFIAGILFSVILMLTERGRGLDQMSLPRFATWGAVSGVLLSALFTRAASLSGADVLVIAPTFAVACSVSASGSLALARRAVRRQLPDGRGAMEAELTGREKRKLR
ncbi:MAG: hypothetical protein ACREMS_01160 [Gemmatimonadaceae bacterium]